MQGSTRAHALAAAIAAAGIVVVGALEVHRGVPHLPVVVLARGVWAASMLAVALYVLRPRGRLPLPAAAAVLASVGALTALAWADGLAGSGAVSYLVTAPLFVVALVPDSRVAVVGAAASLAGTIGVGAALGLEVLVVLKVAILSGFAGAFAVMGSVLQERARGAERALAGERARAMEALAISERRRAATEPLAAAGTRALAAAHDMSGPISAVRTNLDWLDEALRDGRLSAADEEVSAVVGDARAAADALVRSLSELKVASDAAKRAARAAERESGVAEAAGARPARAGASGE